MTCPQVTERLSEYWGNELDEGTKRTLEAHLQGCVLCQREWEGFQAAMVALKSAPIPPPPPDLLQRIRYAVIQRQQRQRRPVLVWRWAVGFAAAAASVLLAFPMLSYVRQKTAAPEMPAMVAMSRQPILAQKPPQLLPPSASRPGTMGREQREPPLLAEASPFQKRLEQPSLPTRVPEPATSFEAPPSPAAELLRQFRLSPPPSESSPRQAEISPEAKKDQPKPEAPKIAEMPPRLRPSPPSVADMPMREEGLQPAPEGLGRLGGRAGQAFGGGLTQAQQAIAMALPFQWQWERFEPVLVNQTSVWELTLKTNIAQKVTVTVQAGENVRVPNAISEPTEKTSKEATDGAILWSGQVTPDKIAKVPILVQATQAGARRMMLTARTPEGKTSSWWIVFAATETVEPSTPNKPITVYADGWQLLDFMSHLAWETKTAMIVPAPLASLLITLQIENRPLSEILSALEKQIGGRWQRTDNSFTLKIPTLDDPITAPKER